VKEEGEGVPPDPRKRNGFCCRTQKESKRGTDEEKNKSGKSDLGRPHLTGVFLPKTEVPNILEKGNTEGTLSVCKGKGLLAPLGEDDRGGEGGKGKGGKEKGDLRRRRKKKRGEFPLLGKEQGGGEGQRQKELDRRKKREAINALLAAGMTTRVRQIESPQRTSWGEGSGAAGKESTGSKKHRGPEEENQSNGGEKGFRSQCRGILKGKTLNGCQRRLPEGGKGRRSLRRGELRDERGKDIASWGGKGPTSRRTEPYGPKDPWNGSKKKGRS